VGLGKLKLYIFGPLQYPNTNKHICLKHCTANLYHKNTRHSPRLVKVHDYLVGRLQKSSINTPEKYQPMIKYISQHNIRNFIYLV